jgi:hypothetical protein
MKIYTLDELSYLMDSQPSICVYDPEGNVIGEVTRVSSQSPQHWKLEFFDEERAFLCEYATSTDEAIVMMMSHFGSDQLRATMDRYRYVRFFPKGSSLEWKPRSLDRWRTAVRSPIQLKPRIRLAGLDCIDLVESDQLRMAN